MQEMQKKVSLLTERCQSAERERKEARRERDESVKQLQQVPILFGWVASNCMWLGC